MSHANSRTAVYTGSFDPITLGHLNVIQRGSRLVDRLIVGIGINPDKSPMFTVDERIELIGTHVAAHEFAAHAGTIDYEVLTNLGTRAARRYTGG